MSLEQVERQGRWVSLRRVLEAASERLDRFSRGILVGAVAFVVLVDGGYAVHFGSRPRFFDEGDYLAIAKNLARGQGFSIDGSAATARRAPGFPALLAVLRAGDIPVTALRLVNIVLLAGTVWMAWTLAHRISGRTAAALAAMGTAVYPLQVFTASTFYPETLATTLLVGAVLSAVRADETESSGLRGRAGWLGLSGLLLSLLILTDPTYVVAAIAVLVWFAWRHHACGIPPVGLFLIMLLIPIAVWTVRNAVELHAFVPVTTGTGTNLLLGNSEHTTADSGVFVDISRYARIADERHLDEVARDRYYRAAALDYMGNHPARSALVFGEKTLNYFSAFNRLGTGSESSPSRNAIAALSYYPLLLCLLVRLAMVRRLPLLPAELLMIVIYFVMAPAFGLFVTRVRYRVPCDELLIVLVSVFLGRLALQRLPSTNAQRR